ncbi:hypothetical protein [Vulcanisaeta sp. JCM 16161]|uniref:hypothetical protein n=1 Tax=Vulcanisaeta sp. JCM 16161 TaxID=1295372 RepID=UPI0006D221EC|nr:hypothetical protein [Vulcanisaeta sp. JCM 16161]
MHSLILTALIIGLLINTPGIEALTQLNYLYSGNYEPIVWPIINVTLAVNKSVINGIVIVVSPSTESINEAFTGLLVLPNNTSYVITGFLGSSSIYIVSIERMPNQSLINTQYGQYYGTVKKGVVRGSSSGVGNSVPGSSTGNLNRTESTKEVSKRETPWSISYPLIVITATLLIISVSLVSMYIRRGMKYPDCLEYGITRIVRKMRINEPGITHRELGNYIVDRINERQTVEELVRLFEEGMYGNRVVDCRRFMALVKRVLRRI